MKIGLIFGTFNPIHIGHISIGDVALKHLDKVIYILTPLSPDKVGIESASYEHRYEMLRLATLNNDRILISDIEYNLPVPSMTSTTLVELSKLYEHDELYLIFGADNINSMHSWELYDEVISKYKRVGLVRDGVALNKIVDIEMISPVNISSTMIRSDINKYKAYLSNEVYEYILRNKLY